MTEIRTVIVGTKFRGAEAITALAELGQDIEILLKAEPTNSFDRNAVACYGNGQHLGYVPRDRNAPLAAALRKGQPVKCMVTLSAIVDAGNVVAAPKILISWEESPARDIGPNQNDGPADFRE